MANNHNKYKKIENSTNISYIVETIYYILGGKQMTKYTQEVKDKAVELVKQGVPLKEIQRTLGPNPKAVERYLAKAGVAKPKIVKAATTEKVTPKKNKKSNDSFVEEVSYS